MPTRAQYVAQRVGARMQSRGDEMLLRRTSLSSGAVPYRNPPDVSPDAVVTSGVASNGQAWLGIAGSAVTGRLVAGDQIETWASGAFVPSATWTVGVMPPAVATDRDGVPLVDASHVPILGTPTPYSPDALAAADAWAAIPVSADGAPDPAGCVGQFPVFHYAADQAVYGVVLQYAEMVQFGWTEADTIGLRIAAYNVGPVDPPKVDDLVIIAGVARSVISVAATSANNVNLAYMVQAR